MKHLLLFVLAVCTPVLSLLAQQVSVSASVNSNTVGTQEAVVYTIQVEGVAAGDVERPQAPEAAGLTLARPNPGMQTSVSIYQWQDVSEYFVRMVVYSRPGGYCLGLVWQR